MGNDKTSVSRLCGEGHFLWVLKVEQKSHRTGDRETCQAEGVNMCRLRVPVGGHLEQKKLKCGPVAWRIRQSSW